MMKDKEFEAISIQQSYDKLAISKCVKETANVSGQIFKYILDHLSTITPKTKMIYAQAWPIMSEILINKFSFQSLVYQKTDNDMDFYEHISFGTNHGVISTSGTNHGVLANCTKQYKYHTKDSNINIDPTVPIPKALIHSSHSNYIFTFKIMT